MFWLILIIVSIGGILYGVKKNEIIRVISLAGVIISSMLSLGFIFEGTTDYSYLMRNKVWAEEQEKYIQTIVDLKVLPITIKDNVIGGSSIDRKVDYIEDVAVCKAKYNSHLRICLYAMNRSLIWWFREGIYISDKILELKELK